MGKLIPLIFLAVMVWQIVAGLIQQAQKKKQIEQQREAAARRAALTPTRVGPAPPTAPKRTTNLQTLADRRKAQLAELRARRQSRGASKPTTTMSARLPAPAPARPAKPKVRHQIETLASGHEGLRRNREADVRRRAAEVRTRAEHDRRQRRQREIEEQRLQEARERAKKAEAEAQRLARKAREAAAAPLAFGGVSGRRLAALLNDRASLRSAFVLKELLDRPVALRERGEEATLPS